MCESFYSSLWQSVATQRKWPRRKSWWPRPENLLDVCRAALRLLTLSRSPLWAPRQTPKIRRGGGGGSIGGSGPQFSAGGGTLHSLPSLFAFIVHLVFVTHGVMMRNILASRHYRGGKKVPFPRRRWRERAERPFLIAEIGLGGIHEKRLSVSLPRARSAPVSYFFAQSQQTKTQHSRHHQSGLAYFCSFHRTDDDDDVHFLYRLLIAKLISNYSLERVRKALGSAAWPPYTAKAVP